jgi:hypothetical protein
MNNKILLAVVAVIIVGVSVFILSGSEVDDGNYIGEKKAIEIFNNRSPNDDFKIVIASGSMSHGVGHSHGAGSVFTYSHLGYPKLDKVDSAKLTDFEGKKVYEFKISLGHNVMANAYIDAKTGELIK